MHLQFPSLHDSEISKADDGTFTLSLEPWFSEPIEGIPTKKLAREIAHACYEAMREYGRNAMMD